MSIITKAGRARLLLALGVGCAAALAGAPAASAATPVLVFYLHPDGAPTWASHQIGTPCLGDPAMTWAAGLTIITCRTGTNALWLGWSKNGAAWQARFVASSGTTYSNPAIATSGAMVEIAVQGPGQSLWFWSAVNVNANWNVDLVGGPGTAYSGTYGHFGAGPAITDSGTAVQIAVQGQNDSLWFYQASHGSNLWHAQQVAGSGTAAGSPAMALHGSVVEIAAVNSPMGFWYADLSTLNFNFEQVSSAPLDPNPALVRTTNGTEIAANVDGCTGLYDNIDGTVTWTNPFTCLPAPSPELNSPAMVRFSGGTEIANTLLDDSLQFLTNTDGSSSWTSMQVVPPGNVSSAPAMVRLPHDTEIAVMLG